MLDRYAKVDPETCAFTKPQNSNVVYGSLTFVGLQHRILTVY